VEVTLAADVEEVVGGTLIDEAKRFPDATAEGVIITVECELVFATIVTLVRVVVREERGEDGLSAVNAVVIAEETLVFVVVATKLEVVSATGNGPELVAED
jgi:hypothetical protein